MSVSDSERQHFRIAFRHVIVLHIFEGREGIDLRLLTDGIVEARKRIVLELCEHREQDVAGDGVELTSEALLRGVVSERIR